MRSLCAHAAIFVTTAALVVAGCTQPSQGGDEDVLKHPIPGDEGAAPPSAASDALYEVESKPDIAYYSGADADDEKHRLDLYIPKGIKNAPVFMFVHGGAWCFGDRSRYTRLGECFARQGFVTAAISYRLSPGVQHPEHVRDVARAFAWIHANIGTYGGDASHIFISGHSAGAHLVALLALDERWLKEQGRATSEIKGVVSLSGPYQFRTKMFESAFGSDEKTIADAQPVNHVNDGGPPMLLIYAEKDPRMLAESAQLLKTRLDNVKSPVEMYEALDRRHISIITNFSDPNDPATIKALAFMRRIGSEK